MKNYLKSKIFSIPKVIKKEGIYGLVLRVLNNLGYKIK